MMASYDMFEITITGCGAHGAMPHKGIDPIVIGAELTQKLQTIVSRNVDPLDPAVLSVTKFHSGSAWNIIPNEAVLGGTVRAFDTRVQELIEKRIRELCEGTAASHNASISVRYERRYPPTVNHAEQAALCERVARALVGADNLILDPKPAMGSEDFAWMLLAQAGLLCVDRQRHRIERRLHGPQPGLRLQRFDPADGRGLLGAPGRNRACRANL
jgi:amidohydrolase